MLLVLLALVHLAIASKECPPLPGDGLPNGRFHRISRHSVLLKCDKDFILIGSSRITCHNGSWTPPFDAICLRPHNICPPPPDVPNADKFGDDRQIGSRTYYSCHQDYFMYGSNMLQCEPHLSWNRDPPVCIARLNNVNDIADRIRNEAGLREGAASENETSDMKGLILDKEVYVKGLELFLLLDRSSSVDPIDLELSKSFFRTLIETFGVDNSLKKSKTRLCVLTFGDKANEVVALTNSAINSTESAMLKINAIKPEGGGTAITAALSMVMDYINSLRDEAKRALFLLTDGEPTIGETQPEDIADLLKTINFEVFTVGIGRGISRDRLAKIASKPSENHVFFLDTFKDFETILDLVQNPLPTIPPTPPPGPDACGVDDKDASKPWMTAIVVHHSKSNTVTFCAGVLICHQWVLTSGACVTNVTDSHTASRISVIIGAKDLTKSGHNYFAARVRVSAQEPKDRAANFKLALVKLNQPIPSNVARPVCVENHKRLTDPFFREQQVQVQLEGWGTRNWNSSLSTIDLTSSANRHLSLASNATTLQEYLCTEALISRTNIEKPSPDEFFCAGSAQTANKNYKKDSCVGSLGSPLIIKDDRNRYQLLGVQTHQHGCVDQPIIYLNIAQYLPWIKSVTKNCHEQHRN